MLIREMNQDKKLLKSYNLTDGAVYKPGLNAVYLGISIYKKSESGASYTGYKNLFANGFEAKLTAAEKDSVIENPDEETTVYDILKKMILNADASEKDISAYKMTYSEFYNTVCPQLAEDLFLEYHSYYNMYPNGKIVGKYMTTCKLENVDSDAKARLARVRESVDTFLASVDSRMSDLEKVLLAHEYVVTHTQYKNDNTISHKAGGPLGNGYGVCDGYAEALIVLLHEVGIETDMVRSHETMNHAWVYVKLDGSWYHIDPTWDDTQDKYRHRYLIRNDEEMGTINASKPHSDWKCENVKVSSVSTKYSDWFVHNVYGTMYYYHGMWYYWDNNTNSILCSDIMGKTTKTVVDGTDKDKLKLSGLSGNKLSYYIGTTQYTISL